MAGYRVGRRSKEARGRRGTISIWRTRDESKARRLPQKWKRRIQRSFR